MEVEELVVETTDIAGNVSDAVLTETIDPYIQFIESDGLQQLRVKPAFRSLSIRKQVGLAVLATEAQFRLGYRSNRGREAVELLQTCDIGVDAGYPALRELEQDGLVERQSMKYFLQPETAEELVSVIGSEDGQ